MSNNHLLIRRLALIDQAIATTPLNHKEIAALTFTSERHMIDCLKTMVADGRAHVAAWGKNGQSRTPLYLAGPGKPALRPKPKTRAELRKAYRARIRKDPVANELFLARKRAKGWASRAAKKPQTWASTLSTGRRQKINQEGAAC